MSAEPRPGSGFLPHDAQQRLIAASKVGGPGTLARRAAIAKANRYIEEKYPEYLKKEDDNG